MKKIVKKWSGKEMAAALAEAERGEDRIYH
jgi:hypothetical protein